MTDFETFYNTYYQKAYMHVIKKVRDRHDAEDLVCEAFLYCYRHYADYDETKASPGTWLYLVLNSRIKNYYRDQKAHVALEEAGDLPDPDEDMLSRAIELKEMRTNIARALKTLPEVQRRIVICRYFRNMSAREIGQQVGLSEGNVRVQLSRALAKMRQYVNV